MKTHLCSVLLTVSLTAGCQTSGTSKWISSSGQFEDIKDPITETATLTSKGNDFGLGANFEIGSDPYAYDSIPPGVRPAIDTIEGGIWYSADKIEAKGRTAGNRIHDKKINAYLNKVACKLAGPYCPDMRVYLLRVPIFNAAMSPNGMMSIYTGFLLRVQNEAQLASVVGHEIGHYIRRHGIQRLEDNIAKRQFGMVFGMLMAVAGVPAMSDVMQLAMLSSQYAFSRDNEREADVIGITLLHMNGYDVREAGKIWESLIREENPDQDPEEVSTSTPFASTHPSSGERTETLSAIANKLQGPDKWGKSNKTDFDRIIGPWKFKYLEDEVRLRNWKSSLEVLEILQENGHKESEISYFKGEIFRNRNRDADPDAEEEKDREADSARALKAYETSMSQTDAPPEAFRAAGLLYNREKMTEKARHALSTYLRLKPNAHDAKLIEYMITNLKGTTS